ncbi:MAG: cell wall hydrolase [Clostridia bacterium]|nr:cell wall hydrolase [Clostridia bacterium]
MKRAVCVWLAALAALFPVGVRAMTPAGAAPIEQMETDAGNPRLTARDRAYFASMLAANYGGDPYAAEVGIAALVLRRMRMPGYPDSAAGVIAALRAEGEFLLPPDTKKDPGRMRRARDAIRDAEAGMDPSGGALFFRSAPALSGFDLRFDDAREDAARRETERLLADCRVVCGRVGFW